MLLESLSIAGRPTTGELDIVIPATPSAIPIVTEGVIQFLQDTEWSPDELGWIELALREALANGIRHGCNGDPSKHVECSVTCESEDLTIVVRDQGEGFDLSAVPDPIDEANLMRTSGRGVFLIRQLMDEVAYENGGSAVRMRLHRDRSRTR
jgi:serine/threonine-protein kinase RsbW